jgi:putative transposase
MNNNVRKYHRRSIRLAEYDYSQSGAYFVTVCTYNRECLFGKIENEDMILNTYGRLILEKWNRMTHHFPNIQLDQFQVMPNHIHGIIIIMDDCFRAKHSGVDSDTSFKYQAGNASPLRDLDRPHGTKPGSLSSIMQNFLSITTRKINRIRKLPGARLWQRNFYEHIIRNDNELNKIRDYIIYNPLNWALDRNKPSNWKKDQENQ